MDYPTFKRILTTFADMPASVDATKGKLVCEIRDEMIEARTEWREGEVWVIENDQEMRAGHWLIKRVAKLPTLADRILTYVDEPKCFINPQVDLLNNLDDKRDEERTCVGDAAQLTTELLGRRPVGSTNVVYLTSDAGEGKTTLISYLARLQAAKYKQRESDWLLVPITLGGKPFLRFDDLVVGFLTNRLRFPMFYYEAFMEMVKMGFLVPAFDGFEEMFVQNPTGDALSAVGNLMRTLDSSGTVLIAARKAYFDYQDTRIQARVFDTIGASSVVFSRAALRRWAKPEFLEYCERREMDNGVQIYDQVADRLQDSCHPLLTRAVLVKRLLDVAEKSENLADLLKQVGESPSDYFGVFVNAIVIREAQEKWIDSSGDPAKPLLSVQDHFDLLSAVAQEMWTLSTDTLKDEVLDLLTELFCESRKLPATVTSQVRQRTKQHALIVRTNGTRQSYSFDHEEFKNFFLGVAIGRICANADAAEKIELLTLLRRGSLPIQSVDAAVSTVLRCEMGQRKKTPHFLQGVAVLDGPTSFTYENVARLLLKMLHGLDCGPMTLTGLVFGEDALRGLHLLNITFRDCSFADTSLQHTTTNRCRFEGCHFGRLDLDRSMVIRDTVIEGGEVGSVVPPVKKDPIFAPELFPALLRAVGFELPGQTVQKRTVADFPEDESVKLLRKLLRQIGMRTRISEEGVKHLGHRGGMFLKESVPKLVKAGILLSERNPATRMEQYRLAISMDRIQQALRTSHKSLDGLIAALS